MNLTVGFTQVSCLNEKGEVVVGEFYDSYVLDNNAYDLEAFINILNSSGYVYGTHYLIGYAKYVKYNNSGKFEEVLIPVLLDQNGTPYYTLYPTGLVNGGEYYEQILTKISQTYDQYINLLVEYGTNIVIARSIYEPSKGFREIKANFQREEGFRLEREKSERKAREKKEKKEKDRLKRLEEEKKKSMEATQEPVPEPTQEVEDKPEVLDVPEPVQEEIVQESVQEDVVLEVVPEPIPEVSQEVVKEEDLEVSLSDLGLEVEEDEETSEDTVEPLELEGLEEVETTEEETVETSEFEFEDKNLNHITIEDIINNKNEILKGNSIGFKPRIRTTKELLYVKDLDELIDIYQSTKDRRPIFSVSQEILMSIAEHFGENEKYPLKVIFDAYHFSEIEAMLHIEVLDKSPNNLYEGLFKHLYLYKTYMEITEDISPEEFSILSVMRHISLSTLSQSAVGVSYGEEGEDGEDANENTEYLLENDPINETNDGLKEYLTEVIIRAKLTNMDGNLVQGEDKIKEICRKSVNGEVFRIEKDPFLTLVGVPYLDIVLKSNQVDLVVSGLNISPNVLGKLYNIYKSNIKNFENSINGGQGKQPTEKELSEGMDYNTILKEMQNSKDFASVYGITQYRPISDIFDMDLNVNFIVVPSVNGKKLPTPIGLVATNMNAVNVNRNKVFIPFFGDFLGNLDKLGITLNTDLTCGKNDKLKTYTVFPSGMKNMTKEFGPKIIEVGDIKNLEGLEKAFNRTKNLEGLIIPSFVKNTSESVEKIYSLFGLFS